MSAAGGIVVAGGRSSRMGAPKATLGWHGSTLVRRVAGIVARAVGGPVVIVRSPGQPLPVLPWYFEVIDDPVEGKGPLAALGAGLAALEDRCEVAFASATDLPFLHPAFVRAVLAGLGEDLDACVPCVRGFSQTLAAAYRTSLVPVVNALVSQDRLRVSLLLDACRQRQPDEESLLADALLAQVDPGLDSVANLNDTAEYQAALSRSQPTVAVRHLPRDASSDDGPRGWLSVPAASIQAAAAACGVSLGALSEVRLNGERVAPDPEEPLAEGDEVCLVGHSATS